MPHIIALIIIQLPINNITNYSAPNHIINDYSILSYRTNDFPASY